MNTPDMTAEINALYEKAYKQGIQHSISIIELCKTHPRGVQLAIDRLTEILKPTQDAKPTPT